MGFFKKAFKKVAKIVTFGAYRGGDGGGDGGDVGAPTPAPEITLNQKDEGEAKEKVENAKLKTRKGKKALKISKNEAPATGVGRNIV